MLGEIGGAHTVNLTPQWRLRRSIQELSTKLCRIGIKGIYFVQDINSRNIDSEREYLRTPAPVEPLGVPVSLDHINQIVSCCIGFSNGYVRIANPKFREYGFDRLMI